MPKLTAGIARTVINPPIGTNLTGYAGRIPGCTAVHDDIYAKALVLSDGLNRVAVVTLDLLGLNSTQVAQIRQDASARTGIPAGSILIGASHTHAGPATQLLRACGCHDEDYVARLLVMIADTIEAASKDMRPAKFGFGIGEAHVAINRRCRTPNGEVQIGVNKGGLTDPRVGIWRFTDETGNALATIFNYACHAVTMAGDNREVSADWPGAAQRAIEAQVGGQAMFLQGCCGNLNPGPRGGFDVAEQNGRAVADGVLAVLDSIALTDDAEISTASEVMDAPLQPPISVEEAERTIRAANEELAKPDQPLGTIQINEAYRDWAQTILDEGGKPSVPFEVQRVSVDGANLVGLPGEVFVEYALNIKKMRPNTIVSAYTNGNVGYVPTESAFAEGGYEVDMAYKLYGEQMLTPDIERLTFAAAERLLTE